MKKLFFLVVAGLLISVTAHAGAYKCKPGNIGSDATGIVAVTVKECGIGTPLVGQYLTFGANADMEIYLFVTALQTGKRIWFSFDGDNYPSGGPGDPVSCPPGGCEQVPIEIKSLYIVD